MFVCNGTVRTLTGFKRVCVTHNLWDALGGWHELYEEKGGTSVAMETELNAQLEIQVASEAMEKWALGEQMRKMLRVRDIHCFVTECDLLKEIKVEILEHILLERNLLTRWIAVRKILAKHVSALCNLSPMPSLMKLEACKHQLSDPSSSLGRLLVATALFNFDQDKEQPPSNWMVHFKNRSFPEHNWCHHVKKVESWRPSSPLCRWEYLATDLVHMLFREARSHSSQGLSTNVSLVQKTLPQQVKAATAISDVSDGRRKTYCLFQPMAKDSRQVNFCASADSSEKTAPQQIELLPLNASEFLPQLHCFAHRRLGPQTPRLLAVLMEQLATAQPAVPVVLSLQKLSSRATSENDTPQRHALRRKNLVRIINLLQQEVLMHHVLENTDSTQQSFSKGGLVHVLRWEGPQHMFVSPQQDAYQVRILLDNSFFDAKGNCLAKHWENLPEALFVPDNQTHPYAPALFAFIRQKFNAQPKNNWTLHVQTLLEQCGIWYSPSGKYRALENLKRDLAFLKQQGWLYQWHITEYPQRKTLHQECTLTASVPTAIHETLKKSALRC